jgi:fibronectin type III domain protein
VRASLIFVLVAVGCGGGSKKDLGRVPTTGPDAEIEIPVDAAVPRPPDAPIVVPRDAPVDFPLVVPADAGPDLAIAVLDSGTDLSPDAVISPGMDAQATDASFDTVTADARTDVGPDASVDAGPAWGAMLQATPVDLQTIGGASHGSSTKLRLSWSAPPVAFDHYVLTATDGASGTATTQSLPATELAYTLTGLNAATTYTLGLSACLDVACTAAIGPAAGTASASTPQEVWQLQGAGHTHATLTKVVSDGNVKIHAIRHGQGAPAAQLGRVQLYYGSSNPSAPGLAVATGNMVANAAVPSSVLSFTSLAGTAGLIRPSTATPLVGQVNTGMAVPLTNGTVKMYFEATGSDNKSRIMTVNGQDGLVGQDFNAGASTVCSTNADYSTGGGCAPKVLIGVEGDTLLGNPKLRNVRQFKIGVPTATDWRWDGAAGTFMVFTTDQVTGCSTSNFNHGYAVWDGTNWNVQYDGACPKLFVSVQAADPLHLGGVRYKLYYGDPSITTGKNTGSMLPFLGPKKLMYGDGTRTGAAGTVEFEDWDGTAKARDILFVWPDETTLDATAEGYIDDFVVITPTGDLAFQVLYIATTDGTMPPFTAAAILRNP